MLIAHHYFNIHEKCFRDLELLGPEPPPQTAFPFTHSRLELPGALWKRLLEPAFTYSSRVPRVELSEKSFENLARAFRFQSAGAFCLYSVHFARPHAITPFMPGFLMGIYNILKGVSVHSAPRSNISRHYIKVMKNKNSERKFFKKRRFTKNSKLAFHLLSYRLF